MSKVFERWIEDLADRSGYSYDFIVEVYNEILKTYGKVNHESFEKAAMTRSMDIYMQK